MAISGENFFVSQCISARFLSLLTLLSGVAGATVQVAAIYGSLRKGSYNRGLIGSVIELSKGAVEGVEIKEVDIVSLPMLNTDPLNGDLIDEDAKLKLKQILLSLKAFTLQLHHNN